LKESTKWRKEEKLGDLRKENGRNIKIKTKTRFSNPKK
jgi:hypothetical protein